MIVLRENQDDITKMSGSSQMFLLQHDVEITAGTSSGANEPLPRSDTTLIVYISCHRYRDITGVLCSYWVR